MKNVVSFLVFAVVLYACNGNNKPAETSTVPETQPAPQADVKESEKADFPLLAKYDCKTCHMADQQLAGPSYQAIAARYAGADTAVQYLSGKIMKGGSGVWGEVPMTAHPDMPAADAEQLANYILSLK